jgi:hypothetical protein
MNFVVDAKSSLIISIRDEKGAFRGTTLIHTEICMHFIDTLYPAPKDFLYENFCIKKRLSQTRQT